MGEDILGAHDRQVSNDQGPATPLVENGTSASAAIAGHLGCTQEMGNQGLTPKDQKPTSSGTQSPRGQGAGVRRPEM